MDIFGFNTFYTEKYRELYEELSPQLVEYIYRYLPTEDYNPNCNLVNPVDSVVPIESTDDGYLCGYLYEYPQRYPFYREYDSEKEDFTVYDGFTDSDIESDNDTW